jgi:hypothetical protein
MRYITNDQVIHLEPFEYNRNLIELYSILYIDFLGFYF